MSCNSLDHLVGPTVATETTAIETTAVETIAIETVGTIGTIETIATSRNEKCGLIKRLL